jgi:hypothetical protein
MEQAVLDREIAFGLIAAVIGTLVVSSFFFAEPAAKAQDAENAIYAPDDIRYPLHMAEQKARAKNKNRKSAPPPPPEPDSYYDEDSADSTGDSDIEQPPAEEPEIE